MANPLELYHSMRLGISDFVKAKKSQYKANKMENKLVKSHNNKIAGGATMTGRKNYNTQAGVLRNKVKARDYVGARNYVKTQNAK